MEEPPSYELYWTRLPPNSETHSLWDCLHDGSLLACTSDLLNRSVCLEVEVSHLVEKEEDVRFLIHLDAVTSVEATVAILWPGEFRVTEGLDDAEGRRQVTEYWAKGREQSFGWNEFEISLPTDPLNVTDATLVRSDDRAALQIVGYQDGETIDDRFCTVVIRFSGISASRSDGKPFSLDQLEALGHAYWEAFAERGRRLSPASDDRSDPNP
jgi:hypothetical protein